jgi:PAS domain S-box-containing protein
LWPAGWDRFKVDKDLAANKALLERESELAEVQRIAKVGGVVVDLRDGLRNRRSPEYLVIHGLPPEAINETHEDWVARLHPDDRGRAERQLFDVLESDANRYSSEYRIIRPDDGEVRWIAAEARIERDPTGKPLLLVGAHIDITDRTVASGMLRESEERFRLIADSAPVPMWVTRLDRTRAFANEAYLEFVGVGYDEALVFDWRTILHPDDMARVVRESIDGEASLKPFVLEGRYRRADGLWRWVRSESQPRWDPAGKHIGFIGVAHDITLAKEAEIELRRLNETLEQRIDERTEQLRANEARLRAILETTNQYQSLLDLDGILVFANAVSLSGIGVVSSRIVGTPFWQTPWFSATPGMGESIETAFKTAAAGEAWRSEVKLNFPDGERYFDFALRPAFDGAGKVTAVLAEGVDVTDRRRNEEALRQAQKMEAVGQLTGGVAHDFNNLLTIIRSATDFLRRRDLPEDRRGRYIDAISDTVDRASKLTGQLLAFARRQPLAPRTFDVGAQVASVANLIRPLVGARIQIDLKVEPSVRFAMADVAQFETALINLAVNARDAMGGEGVLEIGVATVDEIPEMRTQPRQTGNFVAVSVTDTGTGIAAKDLDAIFEPFFTTKDVGKGTGLGLSQAFGFAKQSGGEIGVASTLGSGATFTIYLPRTETGTENILPLASAGNAAASGRGHRILVVEDNKDVGEFSTELLQDLGYAIRWVTSASAALAALSEDEFAFDLVFSDVIMPGMNGVEMGTIIRDRYPGLPVVLTSGYSDVLAENVHTGFELIQKPYSVELLSRTLRRAIADQRFERT